MVHLLDYLGKDYGGAVGAGGQVLDEGEYAEQVEFANKVEDIARSHPAVENTPALRTQIEALVAGIRGKTAPEQVSLGAREIQTQLIKLTALVTSPRQCPNQKNVASVFQSTCSGCHGTTGRGDGPLGAGLDPQPSNFRDPAAGALLAPHQAYNTIRLGVPGTGMPSFAHLSEAESWELAFYVVSLRHRPETAEIPAGLPPEKILAEVQEATGDPSLTREKLLERLAVDSDDVWRENLRAAQHPSPEELLQKLRLAQPDESLVAGSGLILTRQKLEDSRKAYTSGDLDLARQKALEAYLEGLEPIEPKLAGIDSDLTRQTERAMMDLRRKLDQSQTPSNDLRTQVDRSFDEALALVDTWLSHEGGGKITPKIAFLATLGIVLREGFEAALLILSLLLITRVEDQKQRSLGGSQVRPATLSVHAGWIAALGVGLVAWFSSAKLLQLSGANRELLEGATSLFAVFMLIALGLWIHRRTEIKRWTAYLNQKVYRAIDGRNYWALGSIAFVAVFREALETVLFLRTLTFDATFGVQMAMVAALVITSIVIIGSTWAALTFSVRVPTRRIFAASSWIMLGLAVILTGKGLHALQESGHLPSTEVVLFSMSNWDILGFYPTLETLVPQLVVAACIIAWGLLSARASKQASALRVEESAVS